MIANLWKIGNMEGMGRFCEKISNCRLLWTEVLGRQY
jgi:hypothetical protein